MKRKLLAVSLILSVIGSVFFALPVSAATNPTTVSFGNNTPVNLNYEAFYNLTSPSSGDVLFVAEGYVNYAVVANEPAAANLAFSFEILSPSNQVMVSTPLNSYGDRPISIYLTATQVSQINSTFSISLINNSGISFAIVGNPAIFGSPTGNQFTQQCTSTNWYNESTGYLLRYNLTDYMQSFMINMMTNINATDSPATSYLTISAGLKYVNDAIGTSGQTQSGSSILIQGISSIQTWCSAIFKSAAGVMTAGAPTTNTSYIQTGQTVPIMMGQTIANGIDGLRAYLGLQNNAGGRTMAGIIVTVIACGFLVYYMTRKGFVDQRIIFIACVLVVVAFAWLGMFPISVLFLLAAGVSIYTLYYFWTRGIL